MVGKTELYAPVPKSRPPKDKPEGEAGKAAEPSQQRAAAPSEFEPKPGDSQAVAQWCQRMNTDQARERYRDRAATAECISALAQ